MTRKKITRAERKRRYESNRKEDNRVARINLLLAPDGNKVLQERLSFGEYRGKRRGKKSFRDGCDVTKEENPGHGDDTLRGTRVWYLTDINERGGPLKNFCVDCGKNDRTPKPNPGQPHTISSPGITVIGENRPDLDLRPGDVIAYWVCPYCGEQPLLDQETEDEEDVTPLLVDPYGNPLAPEKKRKVDQLAEDRYERMKRNAYEWIRQAKLKGLTYKIYDNV